MAAWEERKRNELEQQKVEQSIWETSGNETVAVTAGSETTRAATLADDVAEPEPESAEAETAAVDELRRFVVETFGDGTWKPSGYRGGLKIECVAFGSASSPPGLFPDMGTPQPIHGCAAPTAERLLVQPMAVPIHSFVATAGSSVLQRCAAAGPVADACARVPCCFAQLGLLRSRGQARDAGAVHRAAADSRRGDQGPQVRQLPSPMPVSRPVVCAVPADACVSVCVCLCVSVSVSASVCVCVRAPRVCVCRLRAAPRGRTAA